MKERTFYETIGYPYTALVTTTFRMTLLGRKVIPPLVIALIPLAPVLIMRVLYFLFASRHEFHIGDPFEIYSGICAVMHLQFVVPMMALMRGMTIFSEEKKERTITYLFLRPVPRSVLAAGKYTGSLLSLIVLLSFSLVSVFGILGTFPNTDMITGDFGVLLKDIAVLSLGLAAYAAVLMVVGTFFKHSLLISIFLVFMWDSAAAYIPGF
ncbi:MAG: ABC transporter permease, partial [bacterium]|nr:ABC transporter permease [bacterium]